MEAHTFPTLYSLSSKGKLHQWTMEVLDNGYRVHHGYVGGKITITKWYTAEPKNVGRANETTAHEQALSEARSTFNKKVEQGGVEDPDKAVYEAPFIEPMTAEKWKDFNEKRRKTHQLSWPVFCQPKFDGMRAAIVQGAATSRGGKTWKTAPHILGVLEPVFEKYPDLILDGELYNHAFHDNFNKLSSLIKREKPTEAELAEAKEYVKFYWYDIADPDLKFSERNQMIKEIVQEFPHLVESGFIVQVGAFTCDTEEEIESLYAAALGDNYEGLMVRLDKPYESKRTWSLLKYKPCEDEEFKILEICEGNGNKAGMAAWVWFENPRGNKEKFKTNVKGGAEFATMLLQRKDELVGTWATVEYLNLTPAPAMKPRCGFVTRLRSGPSKD